MYLSCACVPMHSNCHSVFISLLRYKNDFAELGQGSQPIQVCRTLLFHPCLALRVRFSLSFRRRSISAPLYWIPLMSGHLTEFFYCLIKLERKDPLLVFLLEVEENL